MDFMKLLKAVSQAIPLVEQAAGLFLDNAERREWVVAQLVKQLHMKEGLARTAVELAVLFTKTK